MAAPQSTQTTSQTSSAKDNFVSATSYGWFSCVIA